jgi:type II secretory pathway component PulF
MAVYAYKVIDADNATQQGSVVADSPFQARDTLRQRGLRTLQLDEVATTDPQSPRPAFGARRNAAALITLTRELSTLLAVGVPLTEALDNLAEQYPGRFGQGLTQLRDSVSSGQSLAQAMRSRQDLFDPMTIAVVEVGENAGRLDTVLETLADFKERWQELANHIATALIYPAIVFIMAIGVSVFLMTFVVPDILAALLEEGRELPLVTAIVKGASDTLLNHGWWIGPALIGAIGCVGLALARGPGQRWWHRAVLRLPLVGPMIRKQAVVRIATVIATLMRSGVTFERAVRIAENTTTNHVMKDALRHCHEAIHTGSDIAAAVRQTGAFPPTVVQVFAVGQESGRLEDMLDRLARDYDRQVYSLAKRLTAFLEPVTIIFLAIIVGLIVFAMMLPILEASHVL